MRPQETRELIAVSGAWLGVTRAPLESIAEVKPLLAQIDEVHGNLARPQPVSTGFDPAVQAIPKAQAPIDDRHDHPCRAIDHGLGARAARLRAEEPPGNEAAADVLRVRDQRLPEGLRGKQASCQAESGHAERAAQRARDAAKVEQVRG